MGIERVAETRGVAACSTTAVAGSALDVFGLVIGAVAGATCVTGVTGATCVTGATVGLGAAAATGA